MKEKKVCFLFAILLFMLWITVVADEGNEGIILSNATQTYTGQTTVILTVTEGYTVVIPPSIPLVYGAEQTELPLDIKELDQTENSVLSVSVAEPQGSLTQKDGEGTIAYTLYDGDSVFREKQFRETGTYSLSVNVEPEAWYAAPAGEYDGTVTFTISVKAKEGGQ